MKAKLLLNASHGDNCSTGTDRLQWAQWWPEKYDRFRAVQYNSSKDFSKCNQLLELYIFVLIKIKLSFFRKLFVFVLSWKIFPLLRRTLLLLLISTHCGHLRLVLYFASAYFFPVAT